MRSIDFAALKRQLLDSGDIGLIETANLLSTVFDKSTLRPRAEILERREEIHSAVRSTFPTPFAERFQAFLRADEDFHRALETANQGLASSAFKSAFDNIWTGWRQMVHFLPFILMVSINRLDREAVREQAGKELARALYHYQVFYQPAEQDQRESDQRELLVSLLKVIRQLDPKYLTEPRFFLHPLLGGRNSARDVFPPRFDAQLLLIQQIRNRIVHRHLGDRPPDILSGIYSLIEWCFLDLISILAPLCGGFSLVYVTSIDVRADHSEAHGFSFFGGSGPRRVSFVLPPGFQPDANKLHYGQLYLVARGKESLSPVDYLDLTPFLVSELKRSLPQAAATPAEGDQELFLLNEYKEAEGYLRFLEFAGTSLRTIPEGASEADLREAARLIREIRSFRQMAERLADRLPSVGRARSITPEFLRDKARQVSRDHLMSVMDIDRFDESGRPIEGLAPEASRWSFSRALFVEPRETDEVDAFFKSGRRGLILAGASGAGKSNLLCHFYLKQLGTGRPCVFFAGRLLNQPSLSAILEQEFATRLRNGWTLADLDRFLEQSKAELAIFIDAVNEYSHAGGPLELLDKIVKFIEDDHLLPRCQVLVSCRSETWARFRERHEQPLDKQRFYPDSGDALTAAAFEDEPSRRGLYASYQSYFHLVPKNYDALSASVKALVRWPFMTALLAETYGDPNGAPAQTIPPDLDYFRLFRRLTERKIADVQRLMPPGEERQKALPHQVNSCLLLFAQLVYEKLAGAAATEEAADALPADLIFKHERLQPYLAPIAEMAGLSIFDGLLQVGLIERISIAEYDFFGSMTQGRAYKFFHDQYTQFWISAVYRNQVLGAVAPGSLAQTGNVSRLARRITELIERSVNAPVLAGALDHWMHMNMTLDSGKAADLLMPLQNALVAGESGAIRYFVSSMLTGLVMRNIIPPETLYKAASKDGSPRLRMALADAFVDLWPEIPAAAAASALDACQEDRDQRVIERLADIFSERFAVSPRETADYLSQVIRPIEGVGDIGASLFQRSSFLNQIAFMLRFSLTATLSQFESPESMAVLRDFAKSRYSLIVDLIGGERGRGLAGIAKETVRKVIYRKIETTGIGQWKQFCGSMERSRNDLFFVAGDGGVVQRDVLRQWFPYAVALHNGGFDPAWLEPGAECRKLAIQMLNYNVTSIIGYIAMVTLPIPLSKNWQAAQSLMEELLALDTPSARFFGTLLMVNVCYTDESLSGKALGILERMLPRTLERKLECDWVILAAFGIVDNDVAGEWPVCERMMTTMVEHFRTRKDETGATALGDDLGKACFFRHVELGLRVIGLLLESGCLEDAVWRNCTLKIMAAMMARDPSKLRQALAAHGQGETVMREARAFLSDGVIVQSDRFIGQVNWNRLIARSLCAYPKARYLIIKILVGGLTQSNSVTDFAKEFRRFIVQSIAAYFNPGGDESKYDRLSVEECWAETESQAMQGPGEVWRQETEPR